MSKSHHVYTSFKDNPALVKAFRSLLILILVFFIVFLLNIALGLAFIYLGYAGITNLSNPYLLIYSLLSIALGGLLLFGNFLFVFEKDDLDLSYCVEVNEENEPKLFELILKVANEVGVNVPAKIYLTPDCNASILNKTKIFGSSSDKQKILFIGVGVVNIITVAELVGLLAHELEHTKQKTLNVIKYIYHVSSLIKHRLFIEPEEINERVICIKHISKSDSLFKKFYRFLFIRLFTNTDLNRLELSRELEFKADETAAKIAGSDNVINGLIRLHSAKQALDTVVNYYDQRNKYNKYIRAENIYKAQSFELEVWWKKYGLDFVNNLPVINIFKIKRYRTSKLNLSKQWLTHPINSERAEYISRLDRKVDGLSNENANTILSDHLKTQKEFTKLIFLYQKYRDTVKYESYEEFKENYVEWEEKNSFPAIFKNYFDLHSPSTIVLEKLLEKNIEGTKPLHELLADDWIYKAFEFAALNNDINELEQELKYRTVINYFEYDGKEYLRDELNYLLDDLNTRRNELIKLLYKNDEEILKYFLVVAASKEKVELLKTKINEFKVVDQIYSEKIKTYYLMLEHTDFFNKDYKDDIIEDKIESLEDAEALFKKDIKNILLSKQFDKVITLKMRKNFRRYLAENHYYFLNGKYIQKKVDLLFNCIDDYGYILTETLFWTKKDMLEFMSSLEAK